MANPMMDSLRADRFPRVRNTTLGFERNMVYFLSQDDDFSNSSHYDNTPLQYSALFHGC